LLFLLISVLCFSGYAVSQYDIYSGIHSGNADNDISPMATSFDYFEALINKEKFIKSLYEDELIKIKASNEVSDVQLLNCPSC
jgi:hypothetical protein